MNLTKVAGALRRQLPIIGGVLLLGVVVFALALSRGKTYQASTSVVAFAPASSSLGFRDPSKTDPLADPSSAMIAPQDVPALVRSSPLLGAVAKSAGLAAPEAKTLKKRVSAKTGLGSEVITLEVTDSVEERAVRTANALADQLRIFESALATKRYDGLIRDLRSQLGRRSERLRELDTQIAGITAGDPFLSPEIGAAAINQQIVTLEQQYNQARATERADAAAAAVLAQRPALARELAGHEILMEDPEFKERLAQFGKDAAQRDLTAAGYTAAFPGLAGLNEQIARESRSLRAAENAATSDPAKAKSYVEAQLDANKAIAAVAADRQQVATVGAELAAARQHLDGSDDPAVRLASLRRDRDAANAAYSALSARLAATVADRSQAASIGTVVIVDPAVEAPPALLSRPSVLAAALGAVFLWLAITLALAADAYDTRLNDRDAIERLYGRPVLSKI